MANKKTFLSKKDYCSSRKLPYKVFDREMKQYGLYEKVEYGCYQRTTGKPKSKLVPTNYAKGLRVVRDKGAKSGSTSTRTYFWDAEYLDDFFEIDQSGVYDKGVHEEVNVKDSVNDSLVNKDLALPFGKFKGKKIVEMTTDYQLQYCDWLRTKLKTDEKTNSELYNTLTWHIYND